MRRWNSAFLIALMLAALPLPARAADKVVVASKIDTEGALLGNMIALALEKQGIPVERKIQLGPTKIVRGAIQAGEIDIYPEYTGNGAFFFQKESDPAWKSARTAYESVAKLDAGNGLTWLKPAPANNTWAIAVRQDVATPNKLATMEDFGRYVQGGGKIKLAASAEFVESPAALPSFQSVYNFKMTPDQLLVLSGGDTSATIRAAAEGLNNVSAAMVYGTDGALAAVGLVLMADPKGAQIVYEPAPLVRSETLKRYPKIEETLNPIFQSLDLVKLQKLNAAISVEGRNATDVARDYLVKGGFLK
jgi:osmoprotectant transport system substrate-binding protein